MTKNLLENSANKTSILPKLSTKQNSVKTFQKLGFVVMEKNADLRMDTEKWRGTRSKRVLITGQRSACRFGRWVNVVMDQDVNFLIQKAKRVSSY